MVLGPGSRLGTNVVTSLSSWRLVYATWPGSKITHCQWGSVCVVLRRGRGGVLPHYAKPDGDMVTLKSYLPGNKV